MNTTTAFAFVYGTLRLEQRNHAVVSRWVGDAEPAEMRGWLLDFDTYPGVVEGVGRVAGDLFRLTDPEPAWEAMDALEAPYGYRRRSVRVTTRRGPVEADAYFLPLDELAQQSGPGRLVPGGDWLRPNGGWHLYFAYGSCMSPTDLARSVPGARLLGPATLPGRRVAFTLLGRSGTSGVADIVPAADSAVEGVLHLVHEDEWPRLDRREGVHLGHYRRKTVQVRANGLEITARTYEVVQKAPQEIPPSDEYRAIIMEGAGVLSRKYREELGRHMDQLRAKAAGMPPRGREATP